VPFKVCSFSFLLLSIFLLDWCEFNSNVFRLCRQKYNAMGRLEELRRTGKPSIRSCSYFEQHTFPSVDQVKHGITWIEPHRRCNENLYWSITDKIQLKLSNWRLEMKRFCRNLDTTIHCRPKSLRTDGIPTDIAATLQIFAMVGIFK